MVTAGQGGGGDGDELRAGGSGDGSVRTHAPALQRTFSCLLVFLCVFSYLGRGACIAASEFLSYLPTKSGTWFLNMTFS